MIDVRCTECTWAGVADDLISDATLDDDGDMVGDHLNACPACYGSTVDVHDYDDDDLSDHYSS